MRIDNVLNVGWRKGVVVDTEIINNQFHGLSPNSKVSDLPWPHEQRVVGPRRLKYPTAEPQRQAAVAFHPSPCA
jgi:hypothetical protein